ncbi:hypothetical protein HMPREF9094_1235 [Fusobacterium animalis ATCC 51191]|uniref:Uncharacterized protein n=1 Tax=Fusobacterium animalis ATCC 51191 TaxID=997347 RepID=F9EMT0_9FUSO|nr:hypothetical protein HMPREF9094_1235 [Fusobacterium animalis ATCC 51191]
MRTSKKEKINFKIFNDKNLQNLLKLCIILVNDTTYNSIICTIISFISNTYF